MNEQFTLFDDPHPNAPWFHESTSEVSAATVVFPEGITQPLDYAIPETLLGAVQAGCRVLVPLGKSNRPCEAYCVDVHLIDTSQLRLKNVQRVLDSHPLLSPSMIKLTRWLSDYYLCSWGQVLETILPAGVRSQSGTRMATLLSLTPLALAQLSGKAPPIQSGKPLTDTQIKILHTLRDAPRALTALELARMAGVSQAPVNLLKLRGFLETTQQRIRTREFELSSEVLSTDLHLNTQQEQALKIILKMLDAPPCEKTSSLGIPLPPTALLHGVTGSGKTEVYIQAIREVVRRGHQAVVLVPEISLTPQTVSRFRARFQEVAVLHSHLTDAQRFMEWERISSGDVQVVVGARSAVFAPTPRLGMIIMDEEHETSFKQETAPYYHARDVALYRCGQEKVPLILGSATPSLESWYGTQTGKIQLISMPGRVSNRPMPHVTPVDMRQREHKEYAQGALSQKLCLAIKACLEEHHQAILLLNRRGFSTHIQCPSCGYVLTCPHCSITLTHHRVEGIAICHYCDYQQKAPEICPECHRAGIRYSGMGTQRLEEEVTRRFSQARVLRMDTDSMQARGAHEQALAKFRAGDVDILLGTQMIAKGLDFPNVTLVGVINADTALHLPDFRAAERTFQLITQVAGRTGRGKIEGHVLVQTYQPEHPAITAACQHHYMMFAEREMKLRAQLKYPPCCAMARLIIRGLNEGATDNFASGVAERLKDLVMKNVPEGRVLGPAPCPIPKLRDYFRFQIQVHGPIRSELLPLLRQIRDELKTPESIQWIIDLDPQGML